MPTFARAVLLALAVLFAAAPARAAEIDASDTAAIEEIVRAYILKNPEIIQEAMAALEAKRAAEEAARAKAAIADVRDLLYDSPRQIVLGNPEGKVTLVEFFDYNCGFCKRALGDLLALLDQEKDLRVVLKEFPILGDGSVEAARVAVAVKLTAPDKYLAFHTALLGGRGEANEARALEAAKEAGIDVAAVKAAMSDERIGQTLAESTQLAMQIGVTGTPAYVLGDELIYGAVGADTLRDKIAAVRACGKVAC